MSDDADKQAAELIAELADVHRGWCEYCKGSAEICEGTKDSYRCVVPQTREAVAAALREKDAEIQKLKVDADLREDEITRLIKQYDVTDTKLESAREQLERAKVEREELKRTYDKTVERARRTPFPDSSWVQHAEIAKLKEINMTWYSEALEAKSELNKLKAELEAAREECAEAQEAGREYLTELGNAAAELIERDKDIHGLRCDVQELRQAAEQAAERQREKDADIARCCCHHVLGDDPCEASDVVIAILAEVKK